MMKSPGNSLTKLLAAGLSALLLASIGPEKAQAQSALFSDASVGAGNIPSGGGRITPATLSAQHAFGNSLIKTSATQSFTGQDRGGQQQTMTFTGQAAAQSDYTGLHVSASASLTNSYWNFNTRPYADQNGNVINYGIIPPGSPTFLLATSSASFNDTLHYGGALQSGYMARYLFQVDGTNSGAGAEAHLSVTVDGNPGDSFSDSQSGSLSTTWATKDYAVNGVSPQKISVVFQAATVFDTPILNDGQNYAGASNFSDTATLAGIELVDQNGALASGWTVTSASGTKYNAIQGTTPAPSSALTLLLGAIPGVTVLLRRRRQRSHR